MKSRKYQSLLLPFLSLAALLLLIACPTSDEPTRVLSMQIDKDNDSLLTFDSLIVKVYSKDSSYSQEVFHGVLRDPKQVSSMTLDPRVGKEYTVSIIGYKGGKVGVNKQVTVLGPNNFQSKDLPVQTGKDTVVIEPAIPEILAPADTSVAEGDSLRFRVSIRNPLGGATTLTLKNTLPGASLDTAGRGPGDGYFTWRPNLTQGRIEPYAVTIVYASADRKVEKTVSVKVLNTNQPPKIKTIADQKVKEGETLTFTIDATDPDLDSLTLTATGLPEGAAFSSGSFTWKPTLGQAGNHSVKFRAFDGKDSDQVAALITVGNVDVPPPLTVEITSPPRDTVVNFTPITILYTVNGVALQKKFPLKDGINRIRIDTTVQSRAGFDTILITLDTVPPVKPIVAGASPVRTRTPTWTWNSGGNGIGTYRYRLDNEDMTSSTTLTELAYTASKELDAGIHTLFVQERDAAGNWSQSGKHSVRIDTTRPAPPTVTVSPASPTNNTRPTWSWLGEGDDITGLYRYNLDDPSLLTGAAETRGTGYTPKTGEELKEGSHTLYVQQQDSAGNWSTSGSATVSIAFPDTSRPNPPIVKGKTPANIAPRWAWQTGGNKGIGVYRYKLDDGNLNTGTTESLDTSYILPGTLAAGKTYLLFVQEKNAAGNWSLSGSFSIMVDLVPPDPPVVSIPNNASPLDNPKPTWNWVSGGGGSGNYSVVLDDSGGAQTLTSALSFTPSTALPQGVHTLYVREQDSAGNWSKQASVSMIVGRWVKAAEIGQGVRKLVANGDSNVFAGTRNGVSFSGNAGRTWNDVSFGLTGASIGSLAASGENIFVGSPNGVFRSSDNGANWFQVNMGLTDTTVTSLATKGPTLFAGTFGGVFLSTNNGTWWVDVNTGLPTGAIVGSLGISGSNIFAGTIGKGTYVSNDNGSHWNLSNSGLPNSTVNAFAVSGSNVFAGTFGDGVFRSNNNGQSWVAASNGLENQLVNSIAIIGSYLFAGTGSSGTDGGVFLSIDNGANWTALNSGLSDLNIHSVAVGNKFIYAGTESGVFRLAF